MYYKDTQNKLHDDMNGSATHLLPADCVEINEAEAQAIRDAANAPTQEQLYAIAAAVKYQQDVAAAKAYAKLTALKAMTPAQVQTWVAANVTNLAQTQDAIATLAVAVSLLARRL